MFLFIIFLFIIFLFKKEKRKKEVNVNFFGRQLLKNGKHNLLLVVLFCFILWSRIMVMWCERLNLANAQYIECFTISGGHALPNQPLCTSWNTAVHIVNSSQSHTH